MYNVQQPVEQSVSFSLEARIRYDWVVAGYESKRDVAVIGPLQYMSMSYVMCDWGCTYSRVDYAWRLDQDHTLKELDAAYAHARRGGVHAAQDVCLDGRHELPVAGIVGMRDTGTRSSMRECST
jgi:hypothetical protein